MIKDIKKEINKSEPDWLLVADMAKKIYLTQQQSGPFGFKKGIINLIRLSEYNIDTITKEFKEYNFNIIVDRGRRFYKEKLPTINYKDNYTIILSDSDTIMGKLRELNIPFNLFRLTVRNKYDYSPNRKPVMFYLNNENGQKIKFAKGESKREMRDTSLENLLAEFN
jgi:hypothetical protein